MGARRRSWGIVPDGAVDGCVIWGKGILLVLETCGMFGDEKGGETLQVPRALLLPLGFSSVWMMMAFVMHQWADRPLSPHQPGFFTEVFHPHQLCRRGSLNSLHLACCSAHFSGRCSLK